jgi:hypothetical protein
VDALIVVMAIVFGLFAIAAIVYCWKNRPYRGPDDEWRDEAALQADSFVNRSGRM